MADEHQGGRSAAPSVPPSGGRSLGRHFWGLWAAASVSSFGDGLVVVAFPLLALSLTHRPLLISGVLVAARLPALLVGLPAGAYVDRFDRRSLAVGTGWVRLVLLVVFSAVVLFHQDRLPVLYATVFALGACEELFVSATDASLPTLVDASHLERANSWLAFSDLTAEEIGGQSLGGVLTALGASVPFLVDAASFLASALLLNRRLPELPTDRRAVSLRGDIAAGLRWFAGHRSLRQVAGLISSLAFCQSIVMSILVLYAHSELHLSGAGYGLLLAVPGLGAVIGLLGSAKVVARVGPVGTIVASGVVAGGSYVLLGVGHSVVLAGLALTVDGIAVTTGNLASMLLRQRLIPTALLGRVGTTFRMVVFIGLPAGALTGGLLAESLSLRATFVVAGSLQLAVMATVGPRLRGARSPVDEPISPVEDPISLVEDPISTVEDGSWSGLRGDGRRTTS